MSVILCPSHRKKNSTCTQKIVKSLSYNFRKCFVVYSLLYIINAIFHYVRVYSYYKAMLKRKKHQLKCKGKFYVLVLLQFVILINYLLAAFVFCILSRLLDVYGDKIK